MIIQALYDYYNILLEDPDIEISKPGYSVAKVKFAAILSADGQLLDLVPLSEDVKGWTDLMVPEQKKRANGINPYFMCDNSKYVLGCDFDPKKNEITAENFSAFKELNKKILSTVDNKKANAILNYLQSWKPEQCLSDPVIGSKLDMLSKSKGGNIVFRLDCETGYLHEDKDILTAWESYNNSCGENEATGQCLVTGKIETIEKTHQNIKGVRDANTSGATLVGVNAKAFESYGKTQALNAPVGKNAVFAYTTVLNYMLNNKKQHMQIGDATTVFWAEDTSGACEDLLYELINPWEEQKQDSDAKHDHKTTAFVNDSLQKLSAGLPIEEKSDTNFYILGLSPNNARLAVRFWYKDNFGHLIQKVWQHHEDMKIIKDDSKNQMVSISRILRETIPKNAIKKEAAPPLGGALMQSIFTGRPYPQGLFYAIVNRIRSDGDINDIRAGLIKAFLIRNARVQMDKKKEEMITMSLNEQSTNVPYRLGRLFAVLEKVQRDAAEGKLNSTIKDRYFGTASASPRAVFPVLMKLAQHHISKSKYGELADKNIEEILQGIDSFPAHLNSEEQGLFILGYYHQREAFFHKKAAN